MVHDDVPTHRCVAKIVHHPLAVIVARANPIHARAAPAEAILNTEIVRGPGQPFSLDRSGRGGEQGAYSVLTTSKAFSS